MYSSKVGMGRVSFYTLGWLGFGILDIFSGCHWVKEIKAQVKFGSKFLAFCSQFWRGLGKIGQNLDKEA